MIHDVEVFPVLIRKYDKFITESESNNIVSAINKEHFKNHLGTLIGDATSSHNVTIDGKNILDCFHELKTKIFLEVQNYSELIGIDSNKLVFDNSWCNIQKKNSRLIFHIHPNSIISGALYIKMDENSSHIAFKNPNPFSVYAKYFNINDKISKYNIQYCHVKPNTGDLILFPSWLEHGSYYDNLSEERIVLSFNVYYK